MAEPYLQQRCQQIPGRALGPGWPLRVILLSQEGLSLYSCLEESLDEACPQEQGMTLGNAALYREGKFPVRADSYRLFANGTCNSVGIKFISTESRSGQYTPATTSITSVSSWKIKETLEERVRQMCRR